MRLDPVQRIGLTLVAGAFVLGIIVVVLLAKWESHNREAVNLPEGGSPVAATPTPVPLSAAALRGKDVYGKQCQACHPDGGKGVGPALIGLDRQIFTQITRSGKGAMPAFGQTKLSDDQLSDMVAYVDSLSQAALATPSPAASTPVPATLQPGDATAGKAIFGTMCNACHPGGGAGVGPSVKGVKEGTFVQAVRQGRGAMPSFSTSRLSDSDLASMYAYVKSLSAAPSPSVTATLVAPATPTPTKGVSTPGATPTSAAGDPVAGKTAFESATPSCNACHPGGKQGVGPTLVGVTKDRFTQTVRSGKGIMPAYAIANLSDKALADIFAYVQSQSSAPVPTPIPTPTAGQAASTPPKVPHPLDGRSQCLMCHQTGVAGAPKVPANHVGRTNDMCLVCHK